MSFEEEKNLIYYHFNGVYQMKHHKMIQTMMDFSHLISYHTTYNISRSNQRFSHFIDVYNVIGSDFALGHKLHLGLNVNLGQIQGARLWTKRSCLMLEVPSIAKRMLKAPSKGHQTYVRNLLILFETARGAWGGHLSN